MPVISASQAEPHCSEDMSEVEFDTGFYLISSNQAEPQLLVPRLRDIDQGLRSP